MAFCIHCGAGVAEDATFCHSCGGSVQDLTAPAVEGAGPASTPLEEGPGWPASLDMPASSWEAPPPEASASAWDQPEAGAPPPAEVPPGAWDAAPQTPAAVWGADPETPGAAWGSTPEAPPSAWGSTPEAPPAAWGDAPQPPAGAWGPPAQSPASSWNAPPASTPAPAQARFSDPSGTGWPPSLGGPGRSPQPPAPPAAQVHGAGQPVPNYLIPAVFSMLCCCLPFGVVSLVFAIQANTKAGAGLYDEALRNANLARIWLWAAVIGGLLGNGFIIAANVIAALANA